MLTKRNDVSVERLEHRVVMSATPAAVVSPYVDTTLWPTFNIVNAAKASGNLNYTLAFVVADESKQPSWGGYYPVASGYMVDQIAGLRAMGGDVTVSFGGASGTELAEAIKDVSQLEAAYKGPGGRSRRD